MRTQTLIRTLIGAAALALVVGAATPAMAQAGKGGLKGNIITADGKPVDVADITLQFLGDPNQKPEKTFTDKNGAWEKRNLTEGHWSITVKKDGKEVLTATVPDILVVAGSKSTNAPDIAVKPASAGGGGAVRTATSAKEVAEDEKKAKEYEDTKKLMNSVEPAIAAGQFDEALDKLNQLTTKVEKCAVCYAKMGEVYLKKGDQVNAETNYKKALDLKPDMAEVYGALSSLYNDQRKFELAAEMSAKVSELAMAGGGGGDATALYNQGVAMWNAGKGVEAEVALKKATALDPKNADAFYLLAMSQVNQNKLKDALPNFEMYMKLAPTGPKAEEVKGMIALIKKSGG